MENVEVVDDDDDDGFEPLFDYTRVQPLETVTVDDDCSDSSPLQIGKRKRIENPTEEKKLENAKVLQVVDDDGNNEEDWMPLPPKLSSARNLQLDDISILQDLRSKKQELALLAAQSAEDILRAVEESATREFHGSAKSDLETGDTPGKSREEREKIVISVQDNDGVKQFRMYMDDKFEKLFKLHSDKIKVSLESLVFSFDGDKISPTATPGGLGLENNDIIEVHIKKH